MAGRNHLRHALPVTSGYKAAGWSMRSDRHDEEAAAMLRPEVLLRPVRGAAGTLPHSQWGGEPRARADSPASGARRTRRSPGTSLRDGIAETAQVLALLLGSLGKIARRDG